MAKTLKPVKALKPMKAPKEKSIKVFEDITQVRNKLDEGNTECNESIVPIYEEGPFGRGSGAGSSGMQKEKKKRAPRKKKEVPIEASVGEEEEGAT
ncbi:hypothetical protein Dimus_002874 [Dionaea muscipula]